MKYRKKPVVLEAEQLTPEVKLYSANTRAGVAAAAPSSALEAGSTYNLRHSRFGKAVVKILGQSEEWIETEIVAGKLIGMTEEWWPGDHKTVRRSHCIFWPNAERTESRAHGSDSGQTLPSDSVP